MKRKASKKVFQDELLFPANDRFRYTQTNYWLLNRIIAKLSGKTLQQFIIENQFSGVAQDSILFIDNNTDRLDVRAKSYLPDGNYELKPATFEAPEYLLGAGGMNLTLSNFINWNRRLDEHDLIAEETRDKMWEPFNFRNSEFPMASGWGIYSMADQPSYGFTGGGRVGFRKFPKSGLSVFVLTNGYKHHFSADTIINRLAGIVDSTLRSDEALVDEVMFKAFSELDLEQATNFFEEKKAEYATSKIENPMNMLGYEFLQRKKLAVATAIFQINVDEYPESWNAWDSLGECQATTGDINSAISSYQNLSR